MVGAEPAPPPAGVRTAQVAELATDTGALHIRLLTDDGVVACSLPLPEGGEHAARHAAALHGHQSCCPQSSTGLVRALGQAATLAGGYAPWVVVAPEPPARVWLHVRGPSAEHYVPVGPVDALCLLASSVLPLGVAEEDPANWDESRLGDA